MATTPIKPSPKPTASKPTASKPTPTTSTSPNPSTATAKAPSWLVEGRKYIGLQEIKGARDHPKILEWWRLIHAPFKDDETAWCAGYVGGVLETVGVRSTRSAAARSYSTDKKNFVKLTYPVLGAIVVKERGPVFGHVGFLEGFTPGGRPVLLGGNQADGVNRKAIDPASVIGYYWPATVAIPAKVPLPVIGAANASTEA